MEGKEMAQCRLVEGVIEIERKGRRVGWLCRTNSRWRFDNRGFRA